MKTLYIDCSMGCAGDMLTAALLELHPDQEGFLRRMNAALGGRVTVSAAPDVKRGIRGTHVTVCVDGEEEGACHSGATRMHPHTSVAEIVEQIDKMPLPEEVRANARAVYMRIAEAESAVHGCAIENIHFHEVGSLDALADVLNVCELIYELAPERVLASAVHVGSGQVVCAHGVLPVPAPATERILRGVPIYAGDVRGELCTPTGAALLRQFASEYGPMPAMKVSAAGYGTGTKDFPSANVVRVLLGETDAGRDRVAELVCNVDDMSAEDLAFAMEELLALGALDVYFTNIGMKKSRPGIMLTCMCRMDQRDEMLACIFKNTTTIGVREYVCSRYTLKRHMRTVETPSGTVRIKAVEGYGVMREKAEYEDLAHLARQSGKPLSAIRAEVLETERGRGC